MVDNFKLHILMLHNRYQLPGGEDTATESLVTLLRQAGHRVTLQEEDNQRLENLSWKAKLQLFQNTAWNRRVYERIRAEIAHLQPDLLHTHNFFPLFSPAIHTAAKSLDLPTIQHLHNFRLGCLNAYLYRKGEICELCLDRNPWPGLVYRCYRDSFPASLAVWRMITENRRRQTWHKEVDALITPSHFAATKLLRMGIPAAKLHVHPNVILDPLVSRSSLPLPQQPTFLYVGRLMSNKGVMTLLQAWKLLRQPQWQLNIIGDGLERNLLQSYTNSQELLNVHFAGYQAPDQVVTAMLQATAIVVPSQWYETFGYVVIEAFACGRGVIVSRLGALPELVSEGVTGFLVPPQDLSAWYSRLQWCGEHPGEMTVIGDRARQEYLDKYTPAVNYEKLLNIYHSVLSGVDGFSK